MWLRCVTDSMHLLRSARSAPSEGPAYVHFNTHYIMLRVGIEYILRIDIYLKFREEERFFQ